MLNVEEGAIHAVRNNNQGPQISEALFDPMPPEPKLYIATCTHTFMSDFFAALKRMIHENGTGPSYVQQVLNTSLRDAVCHSRGTSSLTLVLLDTNAYLRLAKRVKPLLGKEFGQKDYSLTILKQVEDEVHHSSRLQFHYPWFDDQDLVNERLAARVRLSKDEKGRLDAAVSVLQAHVLSNVTSYTTLNRNPPSPTDCFILAFGQIRPAIVVTDDLGMHLLARDFDIPVWHGHELLKRCSARNALKTCWCVKSMRPWRNNNDLTDSWRAAKHSAFKKIFGPAP